MAAPDRTPPVAIRAYRAQDAAALTDVFYAAVHDLAAPHYSAAQRHAWAPLPPDYERWRARFDAKPPLVATVDGRPVAFMTLEPPVDAVGHVDVAYTHPEFARRGIARALYARVEERARAQGLERLTVDASHLARPLFEAVGFQVVRANRVERGGERLVNFTMEKRLPR